MAVYERTSVVQAPLEEVWAFHSTVDGLVALTPDWFNMEIESVVGPSGEADPDELVEGSEVTLSTRPLDVGPRQAWTSRITHRDHQDGQAVFRDEMVDGPFERWRHTHRFTATADGTRLTDRVRYQFPLGVAAGLSRLAWPGFAAMFSYRHRRTRKLLE